MEGKTNASPLGKGMPDCTFSNNNWNKTEDGNGNWRIEFYASGTFTITKLRGAKKGIDIFVVGGGGCVPGYTEAIAKEMGISMQEVAYIGDDLNCIDLLSQVGCAACPADACDRVKGVPGILVLNKKGGDGCVREWVELLLK